MFALPAGFVGSAPESFIRFGLSNLPDVSSHAGPVEVIAIVGPSAALCGFGGAQHRLLNRLNVDIGSDRRRFFHLCDECAVPKSRFRYRRFRVSRRQLLNVTPQVQPIS